jgi:hypothetical protein
MNLFFRRREEVRMDERDALVFEDIKINVRFKLFALWSSVMFCYFYGDYFELSQPGKLQEMLSGRWALGTVTQGSLLGLAALMAVPCLMGFLSLALPPRLNRWMNIFWGTVFTAIEILTMPGSWNFYVFFGFVEVALTLLIVWFAWTWPKQPAR